MHVYNGVCLREKIVGVCVCVSAYIYIELNVKKLQTLDYFILACGRDADTQTEVSDWGPCCGK